MPAETYTLPLPQLAGAPGVWCTGEDFLRLTSFNADADTRIALGVRFQNADRSTPISYSEPHTPNTDRTAATTDIALATGWLQGLTVIASAGAPIYGHTFVRVDLMRGRGNSATILQTLLAGAVTVITRRAWPGSPIVASIEGPGALRVLTGTDPAADVEVSETVPTGARWRLLSMRVELVTAVAAANREVAVTFDDGTTVYAEAHSGVTQVASLTRQYTAARQGVRGAASVGTGILIAIPDLWLPGGHRIRTSTTNRQAADNFGAPQLLVEEHLEAA